MGLRDGFITKRQGIIVIFRGVNASSRSLVNFSKETLNLARVTFNKALIVLRKHIREETPVKDGDLRKSVKVLNNKKRAKEFIAEIGPDGSAVNAAGDSYAPFVIFGTSRNAANNFLERGAKNARGEIKVLFGNMRAGMRSIIKKVKSKG